MTKVSSFDADLHPRSQVQLLKIQRRDADASNPRYPPSSNMLAAATMTLVHKTSWQSCQRSQMPRSIKLMTSMASPHKVSERRDFRQVASSLIVALFRACPMLPALATVSHLHRIRAKDIGEKTEYHAPRSRKGIAADASWDLVLSLSISFQGLPDGVPYGPGGRLVQT